MHPVELEPGNTVAAPRTIALRAHVYDLGSGVLGVTVNTSSVGVGEHVRSVVCPSNLSAALVSERYPHWFINLGSGLDEAALDLFASWFPRRLAVGRVAVVCAPDKRMQGVRLGAAVTVPLVPRPVQVFPLEAAHQAWSWVVGAGGTHGGLLRDESARIPMLPS